MAGFSDVHCVFLTLFVILTQKPELGVKTQKNQVQKRLWVFTQYWFLGLSPVLYIAGETVIK